MFNVCLVVVTYVHKEYNNFQDLKLIFMISDFKIRNNAFRASEYWCTVGLTDVLRLSQKKSTFLSSVFFIVAKRKRVEP